MRHRVPTFHRCYFSLLWNTKMRLGLTNRGVLAFQTLALTRCARCAGARSFTFLVFFLNASGCTCFARRASAAAFASASCRIRLRCSMIWEPVQASNFEPGVNGAGRGRSPCLQGADLLPELSFIAVLFESDGLTLLFVPDIGQRLKIVIDRIQIDFDSATIALGDDLLRLHQRVHERRAELSVRHSLQTRAPSRQTLWFAHFLTFLSAS